MTKEKKPRHRYVVVSCEGAYHVMVVHAATPDWFRLVATFPTELRATDYADIFSDIELNAFEDDPGYAPPDCGPAPTDLPADTARITLDAIIKAVIAKLPDAPVTSIALPVMVTEPARSTPGPATPPVPAAPIEARAARAADDPGPGPRSVPIPTRLSPAVDADIRTRLLLGQSISQVVAACGVAKGSVEARRHELVAAGKLKSLAEDPSLRTGKVDAEKRLQERIPLARAAILALDAAGQPISYKTVAEQSGLPMGSMFNILQALVAEGFIKILNSRAMTPEDARAKGGIRLVKQAAIVNPQPESEVVSDNPGASATAGAPAPDDKAPPPATLVVPGASAPEKNALPAIKPNPPAASKPVPPVVDAAAVESRIVAYIRVQEDKGWKPQWRELLEVANCTTLQLTTLLDDMAGRKIITRTPKGISLLKPRVAAPANGAAKKSEDDLIAEHLATKGVSYASGDRVTMDMVLDELRRNGRKISEAHGSMRLVGGKRMYPQEMFTEANKLRIMRGDPVWDSRKFDYV